MSQPDLESVLEQVEECIAQAPFGSHNDQITEALRAARDVLHGMRWRSVEDEQPPIGINLLVEAVVHGDYGYTEDETRVFAAYQMSPGCWTYPRGRYDRGISVKRWTPLPALPQETR